MVEGEALHRGHDILGCALSYVRSWGTLHCGSSRHGQWIRNTRCGQAGCYQPYLRHRPRKAYEERIHALLDWKGNDATTFSIVTLIDLCWAGVGRELILPVAASWASGFFHSSLNWVYAVDHRCYRCKLSGLVVGQVNKWFCELFGGIELCSWNFWAIRYAKSS